MRLSPAATEDAVRLLNGRVGGASADAVVGDILATETATTGND